MKKKQQETPVALRICQRCEFWCIVFPYCQNPKSPNAFKACGAGWSCDVWEPNEETRKGMQS